MFLCRDALVDVSRPIHAIVDAFSAVATRIFQDKSKLDKQHLGRSVIGLRALLVTPGMIRLGKVQYTHDGLLIENEDYFPD